MEMPLFATAESLASIRPEVGARIEAVLTSGRYILGDQVSAFETELAAYVGVDHCVGVASGTDALTIGLRALGVRAGAEIVLPSVSFVATAEAILHAGAIPVFADVEPGTWCLSAATVEPALSDRTAAIVPVHLFGNPAPMEDLMEMAQDRGVIVLEDAAQAIGANLGGRRAGALGDGAAVSFYPSKNLGGIGDGGAFLTDDPDAAAAARRLREHGSADRVLHTEVGYTSRLDEVQAAALRVALPHLDAWTASRRRAADAYREAGLGEQVELPRETAGAESCYHLYVVATPSRDRLAKALDAAQVGHRIYYTPVLPDQPSLAAFAPAEQLPEAARYAEECLAIPIGPDLTAEQAERVAAVTRDALG